MRNIINSSGYRFLITLFLLINVWSDSVLSMNDIYLSSVDTNFYELEENNNLFNKITDVAYQCPLQGGNSVYQARSYLAQYDNDPIYTDQLNCFNVGIYRKPSFTSLDEILVMPNPANESFELVSLSNEEVILGYELYDLLGKRNIHSEKLNTRNVHIDCKSLVNGIYLLNIKMSSGAMQQKKISIIH